jgi:hypothetical protein
MSLTVCVIFQLKLPRILNIVRDSTRPDENEVKSEAQFQRLVASFSELPMQPRTPRAPSDRGRYPEEVPEDRDVSRCQTPSDDSDYEEPDAIPFAFAPPTQEPITIRTRTPAASVSGSLCGDDIAADSPGGAAMDVDVVRVYLFVIFIGRNAEIMWSQPPSLFGSPASASLHQWRYTPPPTSSSAVRTSKRKCKSLSCLLSFPIVDAPLLRM